MGKVDDITWVTCWGMYGGWTFFLIKFKEKLSTMKKLFWNRCLLLWWYRLWIRENEFHKSLNTDFSAMEFMSEKAKLKYERNLVRRRNIAHSMSAQE